ncbi:Hpt domain-containing protein [Ruminococcaceae bacterium OttesenSCG-928-N02]|nr:Hpt domain-containing protein [Ruminococcaceae bacterium OttesenSCG-928-N02]
MELKEFYDEIGADYNAVLTRLMGNEAFIKKYLVKFLEDTNFEGLTQAVNKEDYPAVEVHAHTLKGLCSNLELTALCDATTDMVVAVRAQDHARIAPLFEQAQQAYLQIVAGIRQLA